MEAVWTRKYGTYFVRTWLIWIEHADGIDWNWNDHTDDGYYGCGKVWNWMLLKCSIRWLINEVILLELTGLFLFHIDIVAQKLELNYFNNLEYELGCDIWHKIIFTEISMELWNLHGTVNERDNCKVSFEIYFLLH